MCTLKNGPCASLRYLILCKREKRAARFKLYVKGERLAS